MQIKFQIESDAECAVSDVGSLVEMYDGELSSVTDEGNPAIQYVASFPTLQDAVKFATCIAENYVPDTYYFEDSIYDLI